jgi:potassium-dependent mechanosensitive channel
MRSQWVEWAKIVEEIWHYKLFSIQDIPLTVGNIVLGLSLLLVARRLSRISSELIMRRVVERMITDRTAIGTYKNLVFAANFMLFVVIALTVAGIPLSIFTVVGGALAIGIGFGSQNIVSNFISGLILMAEKPIKVGDIVQVGETIGTVTEIGVRATRIKTMENKIWILPNSKFLENAVLNWTDNDPVIRTEVVVGVAYGSDTELVKKLALDVMNKLEFVETNPNARVVFSDFGDNSLMFKLVFWADNMKVGSFEACRSDLRFEIDKAFREHKIEISFPQRDLHLRSSVPIEIVNRT